MFAVNPAMNLTDADREAAWDEISDEVSALLQGQRELHHSAMPFDAASSISIEQQRSDKLTSLGQLERGSREGSVPRAPRQVKYCSAQTLNLGPLGVVSSYVPAINTFKKHLSSVLKLEAVGVGRNDALAKAVYETDGAD